MTSQDATVKAGTPPGPEIPGYRVLGEIGSGGMAAVYEAEHLTLGRRVAIKVIRPEFASEANYRERFLRETRLAAAVRHPGVVTVYDAADSGGLLWMAMDFHPDGDLARWVRRPSPLAEDEVLRLGLLLAEALAAIHDAGLLHRDLKPDNILMGNDGRPLIADLGLARSQGGGDRLTASGQVFGTPAFMAPEQAAGRDDLDARCDVYGLAATLYALMAGQPPFESSSPWATVAQVLHDDPPPLRSLRREASKGFEALLRRAMSKEPGGRPVDARAFAQELAALRNAAHLKTPAPRAPLRISKRVMLVGGTVLGLLALVLLLVLAPDPVPEPTAAAHAAPALAGTSPTDAADAPSRPGATPTGRSTVQPKTGGSNETTDADSRSPGESLQDSGQALSHSWTTLRSGFRGAWVAVPYDLPRLHAAIQATAAQEGWPISRDEASGQLVRVDGSIPGSGSWRIMARPTRDGGHELRITCGVLHDARRAEVVANALAAQLDR